MKVVTQIPYRNIAALHYAEDVEPFIGINLCDPADPESVAEVAIGSQKLHHGFDCVVLDEYVADPKELHAKIRARYEAFLQRAGLT